MGVFKLKIFISEKKSGKLKNYSALKFLNLQVSEIDIRIAMLALKTDFAFCRQLGLRSGEPVKDLSSIRIFFTAGVSGHIKFDNRLTVQHHVDHLSLAAYGHSVPLARFFDHAFCWCKMTKDGTT